MTTGVVPTSGIDTPARPAVLPVTTWPAALLISAVVGTSGLIILTAGNPFLAVVPVLLVSGIAAVLYAPLRWTWYAVMFAVIVADITAPRLPSGQPWTSPVEALRLTLLENLDTVTGVAAFRFAGAEVLVIVLVAIAAIRMLGGSDLDRRAGPLGRDALTPWLLGAFLAIVAMEMWGIATGGDFRQSLWQLRNLLWLPVLTGIALYSIRGPEDLRTLAWTITAVAVAKVGIGLTYYLSFAKPAGFRPPMVTSHNDSVLFTVVIAIWLAAASARPTLQRVTLASAMSGWMMVGIIINNRRTAFVSLLGSLAIYYVLLPTRIRRRVTRYAIYTLPLLGAYVGVGQHMSGPVFAPAAAIVSVFEQKDASSVTRDIENYNLLYTLRQQKLVGSGWGHEYTELTKAYDISQVFEQYRYVAHNGVLWLWTLGGLIGFTVLWMPFVVAIYLAARIHRFATRRDDRAAAYVALTVIAVVLLQAWADMGTQSWTNMMLVSCAFATTVVLAVRTGAWPAFQQRTSAPRWVVGRAEAGASA